MNTEQLRAEQKRIDDLINQKAQQCGLATDKIHPIRDGVADEDGT